MAQEPLVKHLVVDAGGFLKPTSLEKIGEKIYTIRNVVEEIRDHAARQRLQVLPYELVYIEPTPECLKFVTEFAKKTGDFPSLSLTDLRLIAAVYQLEQEHGDANRLRKEPVITKSYAPTKNSLGNPKEIAGFYLPQKNNKEPDNAELSKHMDELSLSSHDAVVNGECEIRDSETALRSESEGSETDSDEEAVIGSAHGDETDEDEKECEEEADENEDGWITPDNIQRALRKLRDENGATEGEGQSIPVACISADFAVQNVLLHMGLRLVTADGLVIKRLRTYILRCFGCFKTTSLMTQRFCPNCGNQTLKRVAVTVNPDTGTLEYHLSTRKRISVRGTKFSLPTFKGGKHAKNPILTADQRAPENRLSKKALQRLDVLDPDYVARDSPFLMKDVTSKSAVLGVRSLQKVDARRNPNDWSRGRKRGGKKR